VVSQVAVAAVAAVVTEAVDNHKSKSVLPKNNESIISYL